MLANGGALQAILVNPATGKGTPESGEHRSGRRIRATQAAPSPGTGVSGQSVFTLVVEADGDYTFTLFAPLAHSIEDDPNTVEVETEFEDNLSLAFGVTITDGDDDTATGDAHDQRGRRHAGRGARGARDLQRAGGSGGHRQSQLRTRRGRLGRREPARQHSARRPDIGRLRSSTGSAPTA